MARKKGQQQEDSHPIALTSIQDEVCTRISALNDGETLGGKRLPFTEIPLLTEEDMRRALLVLVQMVGELRDQIASLQKGK